MKILVLLMCLLPFSACVRNPAPLAPADAEVPILEEFVVLDEMHRRFLAFRDDDIFLRHGFTFNSPYADWLQQVHVLERNPVLADAARILAGLAMSARIHGAQSEVYRRFEKRFSQALRTPAAQESLGQQPQGQGAAAQPPFASSVFARTPQAMILFSGDTQGVLFEQPGPHGNVGGLARRAVTVGHFRREYPDVLLLDAGDAFASGFERAGKINTTLVRAMNQLRYDAMGLGGFDLAMGEVSLRELAAMAEFPMVCSNLEFEQGVAAWIKPYVILERDHFRVAVLSVMPESSGTVIAGGHFVSPEKALRTLLPKLRIMADFVVLLTQIGSEEAALLLGDGTLVDLILGDHSAVSMTSPAYVSAVPKGMGLGLLRLNTAASGAPARVETMPVLLGPDSDAQILQLLDGLR